jgi:hypothetical protein
MEAGSSVHRWQPAGLPVLKAIDEETLNVGASGMNTCMLSPAYLLGLCLNDLENGVPNRRFVYSLSDP